MTDDVLYEQARVALRAAGGLLNLTELAARYSVSKAKMHKAMHKPGAPKPEHSNGNSTVFIAAEVDDYVNRGGLK